MYKAYKDENIHSHYDVYISRTLAKGAADLEVWSMALVLGGSISFFSIYTL